MMSIGRYVLPFWLMSIICLICVSLEFEPEDNYLVDCGSMRNNSVGDRVFVADTFNQNTLSTPRNISVNTTSRSISSTYDLALYQTARIFTGASNYTFSIQKHGHHFVRLYFFPFVDQTENYNLSRAEFSVFAQGFTLLENFQPQSTPEIKEYSLNISFDNLVLSFIPSTNSFAFLNALEVVSLPDELIPSTAETYDPPGERHSLTTRALQTVARVNMGNQTVSPQNDTLWRLWVSDVSSLTHSNLVNFVSEIGAVNFTGGGSTQNIAPPSVYGTATRLNTQPDPNSHYNMTWSFDVDPSFEYLVRFHFCDIVSSAPNTLFFNVYINSLFVARDLDLSNLTSNILGVPYFMDVLTRLSESDELNVTVGPSNVRNAYPNGILNGVEIMKISNSKGSLDVADSETKSLTSDSKPKVWVIAGSAIGALMLLVVLGFVFFMVRRRSGRRSNVGNSTLEHLGANGQGKLHGTSTISKSKIGYRFPFLAIKEATDNFTESLVIGIGGFGKVYKGVLWDGTNVAVKRGAPQSNQGLAEFRTEIEMLSQFRHRHLVSLVGYCDEQNEMIIIYEYMENGTLKNHLYGSDLPKLNWRQRLEICIGSARGLHYLHTGSSKAIIHRDVKSANILLDENLMAKVADFGLSKDGPDIDQTHVSTAVKGSFGYLDPEYLIRQQLTEKSDVYSFGVVMFEILCGRPVIDPSLPREMVNLVEWARMCQKKGELEQVVDPYLVGNMKPESLNKFVEIAEKCLGERGADRPTMGDVLWNLETALQHEGIERKTELPSNHFEASV